MRAKSEIKEYLSSQLNDDIWKKLKNSLLGRELLALGAEVIFENENVKDTMLLQMNPDTADKYGLYMLSQMNETPITNIKPSTVTVEMGSNVKTYAPYELSYSIGNVHFTNIEYTMQGKSVSLINGTYKCYAHNMDISDGAVADGSETYFYDGTNSYSGIKLGNAYPDSIVVYDANELEIPRYSPDVALSNNVDIMYKIVTGVDGNIYIRFLSNDSIYSNPTEFKIDWLDHSAMEFDVEDTEVKHGNNVVAEIKYSSQGNVDDLDYMRNQLKKEMAKYNGLNTPSSVESYVRGLPYVLDAKCEKSENGINVYIKPSSETMDYQTYLDFSEIAAHISLNSILFPNIKVKTANQIRFGVEVSGVSDVKLQNSIKGLLQERYAYENMNFNTVINTSNILAEIYEKFGIVPTVNMTIKEAFVNDKPLSFKPIKNSLKLYNANDEVVAWEENDMLYGMTALKNSLPFNVFKVAASMGTMFLLMYDGSDIEIVNPIMTKNYDWLKGKQIDGYINVDALPDSFPIDVNSIYRLRSSGEEYIYTGETASPATFNANYWVRIDYDTYSAEKEYAHDGYNKFYLYDVSTNTVKPFDGCMQNLLYSDANPNIKYDAWNTSRQTFGNLYDVNFLSTNNALVVHFVFKSAGTEINETITEDGKRVFSPTNWSEKNDSLYDDYLTGTYRSNEYIDKYKGKYQTTFFVSNPLAFKSANNETLEIFQNCSNGNPADMQGLYSGLRNIKTGGVQLKTKSNWFIHNNKSYYAYEITDKYVCVTNGAKNLKINLDGSFLGMMPFKDDLYVISERFITKVQGFEGLKEKEEIYQIYLDHNTPISINQVIREFDNQIAFKTADGKYYTATGFDIYSSNMIGFENIKEVFNDVDLEDDLELGGCTKDFVTAYVLLNNADETGYRFYCYDLNTRQTRIFTKLSESSSISKEVETNPDDDTTNLAEWWGYSETAIRYYNGGGWHGSRLFYYNRNHEYVPINKEHFKDLFIYYDEGVACMLFIDNVDDYSYPVYVAGGYVDDGSGNLIDAYHEGDRMYGLWGGGLDWSKDGEGGVTSNYIPGFFKQCYYSMILAENESKAKISEDQGNNIQPDGNPFYSLYKEYNETRSGGMYEKVTNERVLRPDNLGNTFILDHENPPYQITNSIYKINNGGSGYSIWDITADGTYTPNNVIWNTSANNTSPSPETSDSNHCRKLNIRRLYDRITTTLTIDESAPILEDDTKELTAIGYINTLNNSLVNDKGTEAKYIRYQTLNPNITSSSYLVLDADEIKFL